MITKLQKDKWFLHNYKVKKILSWGLKNDYISLYNDDLIQKLRNIYFGGIPASIILLSNGMSNGFCYDRALLLARTFLDMEDDVKLIYAAVDSLRLNPLLINNNPLYDEHCFVERTTKDGRHLIYDTSLGFVYDKKLYWLMEHPKIRKICDKNSIQKFVQDDDYHYLDDMASDSYASTFILPMIEMTYGRPTEMYSHQGIELLQREVELFKNKINYDKLCQEVDEDIKRLEFSKYDVK